MRCGCKHCGLMTGVFSKYFYDVCEACYQVLYKAHAVWIEQEIIKYAGRK